MIIKNISSDAGNREGLKIVYDDIAPYAKKYSTAYVVEGGLYPHKNFYPHMELYPHRGTHVGRYPHMGLYPGTGLHPKSTTARTYPDLKQDDVFWPGYAICAPGFALLDGRYVNMPNDPYPYGYMSEVVSDKNSMFQADPALTISFTQRFTSIGLTLTFNDFSGDHCSKINVKWYSGSQLISDQDFYPDSAKYFCNNYVQYYDKLVLTFCETSKPFRPVFLTRIDYGIYREFFDDEAKEVSCYQEINSLSESISINTLNFKVMNKSELGLDMQKKQKLQLYFNQELIGAFYLKNGSRKNRTDYYIEAHDAIGILDGNDFPGGVYTGQTVEEVVQQIFEGEYFQYLLDSNLGKKLLYGYIPYTGKRNALVQIAFAIGAVVDTSNFDGVVIYPAQTQCTGVFERSDTFFGVSIEHTDVVTGIRLTVHNYQRSEEVKEIYKDTLNGTAKVIFNEPYHTLSISGGTIDDYGDNYAVISSTGEVVLSGKRYEHFTHSLLKEDPNITINKNVMKVENATLIYEQNAEAALDRVYDYYHHPEKVKGEVVLGNKKLGQVVQIDTDYEGIRTGTLESINYSLTKEIKAEVVIHE